MARLKFVLHERVSKCSSGGRVACSFNGSELKCSVVVLASGGIGRNPVIALCCDNKYWITLFNG